MNPGMVVANRFEIERVAGKGGMGTVYRAIDRSTGRAVALKELIGHSEESAARFFREATLLAELRHPGIVGFVASGTTEEGEPYLAMDWLEGESLSERVARGPLSVAETMELGRRVAEALGFAHGRGVIHRDLKPGNIFLPGRDAARPLILDFGIARMSQPGQTLTRTGVALGSPGYMAPEQARGERHVDGRADLFSLGCVLFRCLAGEPPFPGDALAAMLKAVTDPAPRLASYRADVPAALEDLVQAMLAKSPAARPHDAAAVAAALEAIAAGGPPPSRAGTVVMPTHAGTVLMPAAGPPSVPSARLPAEPPPQSAAPAVTAPTAIPTATSAPATGIKPRWLVAGAVGVVLIAGGVAAAVVLLLQDRPAAARSPAAGPAKTNAVPCLSTRCLDLTYPDPAHVDPLELWDRVMPLVKEVDPSAAFTQMAIFSTVDGTVSLTGDMRARVNSRALVYSFVTKSGRGLDVAAIPGRLVVQESNTPMKPVPWPTCKPKDALRAAWASGAPRGAPSSIIYSAFGGNSPEWTFSVIDRPEYFRRIEGTSGCGIKLKGPK